MLLFWRVYTLLYVMAKPTKKRKLNGRGKLPLELIRPTARDVAALDILCPKLNMKKAQVWRIGLARLVEFEGVKDQVEERARQYA